MRNRRKIKQNNTGNKYTIPEAMNDVKVNIITTTNELETYYSFLPSSYKAWKKLFPNCNYILGLISNKSEDDEFVIKCKKHTDKLYIYKELEGIESGVQAKTTRMYLSTLFDDELSIIIDIDYYLLDKNWFTNLIEIDKFITIGNNGYLDTPDSGKWNMCLTTAKSNIFKKIINPENHSYQEWFEKYKKISDPIDNKESLSNKFINFSDESLFRYILEKHENQDYIKQIWMKQDREDFVKQIASKRIDRLYWNETCNIKKLEEGYYIDVQPLRPFDKNIKRIRPILYYLDIEKENLIF